MKFAVSVAIWINLLWCVYGERKLSCGSPPLLEKASPAEETLEEYSLGSNVVYKCNYGYLSQGVRQSANCRLDSKTKEPTWIVPGDSCIPRSCGDPEHADNARRIGSRFTFPNHVEYVCNEGYKLSGQSKRYCQTTGSWSGKIPTCTVISCNIPEDPTNGKALYSSFEYSSELSYKCNEGFQISNNVVRICGPNGSWTGVEPLCSEIFCPMPVNPKHGRMAIVGNKTTVGSIVVYTCNTGRKLVGSSSAKCLNIGVWTFSSPRCIEPCRIPNIENGDIIKRVTEKYGWLRQTRLVNKKVLEGTILHDSDEVFLKCDSGYAPLKAENQNKDIRIICHEGNLSPEPNCMPLSCEGEPPLAENAKAMVYSRQNGHTIWYKCDDYHNKVKSGEVKCILGAWIGNPPVCQDTRCDKTRLKSEGLLIEPPYMIYDGQSLAAKCNAMYERSSDGNTKITCDKGKWILNGTPCVAASCKGDPPVPENGRIVVYNRNPGSTLTYECENEWFHMVEQSNITCQLGKWEGTLPVCLDTRCYLKNLERSEGVDLNNDPPILPNGRVHVVCRSGYTLNYPRLTCFNGVLKTENSLSPCQPTKTQLLGDVPKLSEEATIKEKNETPFDEEISPNIDERFKMDEEIIIAPSIISKILPAMQDGNNATVPELDAVFKSTIKPTTTYVKKEVSFSDIPGTAISEFLNVTNDNSIDTQILGTELPVINNIDSPNYCNCTYNVEDEHLVAYNGNEVLKFGSKVKNGSIIKLRCSDVGEYRFAGPGEVLCPENCYWHSSQFPSCTRPTSPYDVVIKILTEKENFHITPGGIISLIPGSQLRISCESVSGQYNVNWHAPWTGRAFTSHEYYGSNQQKFRRIYILPYVRPEDSGSYGCYVTFEKRYSVEVQVQDVYCPEFPLTLGLIVTYEPKRKVDTRAIFSCSDPYQRKGPHFVVCQSSGEWSETPAYCQLPICSVDSLFAVLPEIIVPMLEGIDDSVLAYGTSVPLLCDAQSMIATGEAKAVCIGENKWSLGNTQCKNGCLPLPRRKDAKEPLINPEKQSYEVGDSIILSCLNGKHISTDFERVACLPYGWSETWTEEKAPECMLP